MVVRRTSRARSCAVRRTSAVALWLAVRGRMSCQSASERATLVAAVVAGGHSAQNACARGGERPPPPWWRTRSGGAHLRSGRDAAQPGSAACTWPVRPRETDGALRCQEHGWAPAGELSCERPRYFCVATMLEVPTMIATVTPCTRRGCVSSARELDGGMSRT